MPISKGTSLKPTERNLEYDPNDLDDSLKKLPAIISWQIELVDKALTSLKRARFNLEHQENVWFIRFTQEGYSPSEARSLGHVETNKDRGKVLNKDRKFREEQSTLRKLNIELTTIKKRASLRMEEIKHGL